MDGVITNCMKGIANYFNQPYELDIVEEGVGYKYERVLSRDIIDKALHDRDFWINLEKFSWADRIIEIFENRFGDNWIFLTKGADSHNSYCGKYEWIMKHYPQHIDKLWVCRGNKQHACAGPEDFLLDDTRHNIDMWRSRNGTAYHWIEMTEVTETVVINKRLKELEKNMLDLAWKAW